MDYNLDLVSKCIYMCIIQEYPKLYRYLESISQGLVKNMFTSELTIYMRLLYDIFSRRYVGSDNIYYVNLNYD